MITAKVQFINLGIDKYNKEHTLTAQSVDGIYQTATEMVKRIIKNQDVVLSKGKVVSEYKTVGEYKINFTSFGR